MEMDGELLQQQLTTSLEEVQVAEGDSVILVCKVGGYPEPRLVFYKDDKRLRPNENVSIGEHLVHSCSEIPC